MELQSRDHGGVVEARLTYFDVVARFPSPQLAPWPAKAFDAGLVGDRADMTASLA